MNRLTSHCGAINNGNTYYPRCNSFVTGKLFQMMLNKLGKLEDAEEENRLFIFQSPATIDDLETIKNIGRIINNLDDMNKWIK